MQSLHHKMFDCTIEYVMFCGKFYLASMHVVHLASDYFPVFLYIGEQLTWNCRVYVGIITDDCKIRLLCFFCLLMVIIGGNLLYQILPNRITSF